MKLQKCPQCQSKMADLASKSIYLLGGWRTRWFITCRDCNKEAGPYLNPEEAVRFWNRPRRKKA